MRWYLNRAGTAEGPFEEPALVAMIRGGQVAPNAQICPEGGSAWQTLASHPPFGQASQPAAPAAGGTPGVAATVALDSAALGEAFKQHGMSLPGTASAPGSQPGATPQGSSGGFASSAYGSQPGVAQGSPGGFASSSAYGSQPGVAHPGGFASSSAYGSQPGVAPGGGFAPPSGVGYGPPGPASAPKKNNLPLMIGGGCAVLMVLSMCLVLGLFVVARMY